MALNHPELGQEHPGPDELETIRNIVRSNIISLDEQASPTPRAQHPKGHGCVEATFHLRDDLPKNLQHGIFQPGARYKALIRFSNSVQQNDRMFDAHGMAIKLLDIPGRKLQPGQEDSTTLDLMLIDHGVFFSDTLANYAILNTRLGKALNAFHNQPNPFKKWPAMIYNALALLVRLPGTVYRLFRFSFQTPSSPLASNYWSTTPYRLGSQTAVKYMASTPRATPQSARRGVRERNGLSKALKSELEQGPATFTFGLHVQTDPVAQPVENATVRWWPKNDPGGLHAMIPIADITITGFAPDSDALSQNLVFSPWNTIEAHRPLGIMNRIRAYVYHVMADARQLRNGVAPPGSTNPPASLDLKD